MLGVNAAGQSASPSGTGSAVDRYNVVWDSPSADHHGSMPLGNGDITLNAWMTAAGDLHFYIGKTDAWDDNAPAGQGRQGPRPLRAEPLRPPAGPSARSSGSRQGAIEIQAGEPDSPDSFFVRLWVDANDPVIHVTAESADAVEATASIELWRTERREVTEMQVSDIFMNRKRADGTQEPLVVEPDTVLTGQRGRIGWFHHNVKSVGPELWPSSRASRASAGPTRSSAGRSAPS